TKLTSAFANSSEINKTVNPRNFEPGDLVLRRADIGQKNAKDGKLAQNWEGPYRVLSKSGIGGYRMETLTGAPISNSWNAAKLKTYFS
ncbi:MAG: hypothetical protein Q8877_03090, partial [Sweet potato little leaf phytoplasma]|nr:hypothetical protein [Sweet potato little leaf phytoplasma]